MCKNSSKENFLPMGIGRGMVSNTKIRIFHVGLPIRPSQAVNFINQPGGLLGLSIDSCRPEDAGQYSLVVTNKLGEVSYSSYYLLL
jgi:hypothetical protein